MIQTTGNGAVEPVPASSLDGTAARPEVGRPPRAPPEQSPEGQPKRWILSSTMLVAPEATATTAPGRGRRWFGPTVRWEREQTGAEEKLDTRGPSAVRGCQSRVGRARTSSLSLCRGRYSKVHPSGAAAPSVDQVHQDRVKVIGNGVIIMIGLESVSPSTTPGETPPGTLKSFPVRARAASLSQEL